MRREKLVGSIGLGLFFLFPLVSLLQVRDADEPWRQVVGRARPSVLALREGEPGSRPLACAVVLDDSPLRAVVAGRLPAATLVSDDACGSIAWRSIWSDPSGDFSLLEGDRELAAVATAARSSGQAQPAATPDLVPVDPATLGDLESPDDRVESIAAVLVTPARLDAPILVGELRVERDADGRPSYRGSRLRALRAPDGLATAEADPTPAVDPALQGAPFVSRSGVVLALYAGEQAGAERGVPMALVREALARRTRAGAH